MPTLYEEMEAAGLVRGNHCSDLYVLDTPEAREIIKRHRVFGPVPASAFRSNVDGSALIDITFAFDPFWDLKQSRLRNT